MDKKSKTGINIGGDIPDIILHIGIAGLQACLHFADAVQNSRMVTVEFLADIGQAQVGQFPYQIHGHLPCFGDSLGLLGTTQNNFNSAGCFLYNKEVTMAFKPTDLP